MKQRSTIDHKLAQQYGSYASYTTLDAPIEDTFGDSPAAEVDRLLDINWPAISRKTGGG